MRLNSGEGNGASLAGRTSRNTARIDRTAHNVKFCRTFVWMIAVRVPPADERLPTAVSVPTAYRPCNNPAVCSSFVLYPTLAVGAVGILTSFTAGLSSPCVYPSAETIPRHLALATTSILTRALVVARRGAALGSTPRGRTCLTNGVSRPPVFDRRDHLLGGTFVREVLLSLDED